MKGWSGDAGGAFMGAAARAAVASAAMAMRMATTASCSVVLRHHSAARPLAALAVLRRLPGAAAHACQCCKTRVSAGSCVSGSARRRLLASVSLFAAHEPVFCSAAAAGRGAVAACRRLIVERKRELAQSLVIARKGQRRER